MYGLDIDSLNILQDYLSNRKYRTKVDSFYSSWEAIFSGVPRGFILGPFLFFLFNIFMRDMFLILKTTYFTGYADNNTHLLDTNKCHLILNSQEPNTLKIGDLHMNNILSEKLLGITFDCKLKFNKHIEDICQRASHKLNALARLAQYMEKTNKLILMNAFFKSQFDCCPLVRMYCKRSLNSKINRLR